MYSAQPIYQLTYLIGHNNLPGASASCAATPVGYDLVFPTDTRSSSSSHSVDPRIKYPSRRSILHHMNNMAEPAQPLNINTLHNVLVVEELHYWIECWNQLALHRRSYVGLFARILSRLLHHCLIVSMPVRHKEARVRSAFCRVLVLSYERGLLLNCQLLY